MLALKECVLYLMTSRVPAEVPEHIFSVTLCFCQLAPSPWLRRLWSSEVQAQNSCIWTYRHTLCSAHPEAPEFLKKISCRSSHKVFHSNCKRLLYFFLDLLWHVLKFHLSPDVGKEQAWRTLLLHSELSRQRGERQQMPEPSHFPSLSLARSRTESGQGEKEKWLQPLAGVKEFGGCIQEQGELPIAPQLLPSAFLWVHSQPHLLWPRVCLIFMLSEQM